MLRTCTCARRPLSTYRLQLTPSFGFADAAALVPYLAELGITDVYISPPFAAAPGSTHGYDVVDHNVAARRARRRRRLRRAVRGHRRRRHGPARRLRAQPHGHRARQPVVARRARERPVVGVRALLRRRLEPGQARARRTRCWCRCSAISSARCSSAASCSWCAKAAPSSSSYWEHRFPGRRRGRCRACSAIASTRCAPSSATATSTCRSCESILTALEKLAPRDEVSPDAVAERAREKEVAKRRLAALFEASPRIAAFVDENVRIFNGTPGDAAQLRSARRAARRTRPIGWRTGASPARRSTIAASSTSTRSPPSAWRTSASSTTRTSSSSGSSPRARSPGCASITPTGCTRRRPTSAACSSERDGLYVVVEKILEGHEQHADVVAGRRHHRLRVAQRGQRPVRRRRATPPPSPSSTRASPAIGIKLGASSSTRRSACSCARRWRPRSTCSSHRLNRLSARATGARATSRSTRSPARSIEYVARLPIYRTYVEGNDAASVDERDRQLHRVDHPRAPSARRASSTARIYDFLRSVLLLEQPDRRVARVRAQAAAGDRAGHRQGHRGHRLLRLQPPGVAQRGGRRSAALRRQRRGVPPRQRRAPGATGPARSTPPPRTTPSAARTCACASTRCRRFPASGSSALQRWARPGADLQDRATTASSRPTPTTSCSSTRRWSAASPTTARITDEYRARIAQLSGEGAQGGQGRTRRGPTPTRPTRRRRATSPTRCCRRRRSSPTSCRSSQRVAAAARSRRWRRWRSRWRRPACPTSTRAASCGICRSSIPTIAGRSTSALRRRMLDAHRAAG